MKIGINHHFLFMSSAFSQESANAADPLSTDLELGPQESNISGENKEDELVSAHAYEISVADKPWFDLPGKEHHSPSTYYDKLALHFCT